MDLIETLRAIPALGPFIPYLLVLLAIAGVVANFVAPYLKPPESQYGGYAMLYGWVQQISGNRGQASNYNDPVKR